MIGDVLEDLGEPQLLEGGHVDGDDPHDDREVAALAQDVHAEAPEPGQPPGTVVVQKLVDPRPNRPVVLHSADVFVDANGLCYCTDWSGAGLYIMEYQG